MIIFENYRAKKNYLCLKIIFSFWIENRKISLVKKICKLFHQILKLSFSNLYLTKIEKFCQFLYFVFKLNFWTHFEDSNFNLMYCTKKSISFFYLIIVPEKVIKSGKFVELKKYFVNWPLKLHLKKFRVFKVCQF